jgi:hypothetical protein
MKILVVGDLHGNIHAAKNAIAIAKREKCTCIIQVGDFGFWDNIPGATYMWEVQKQARLADIPVFVIPGNHDDYDYLYMCESEHKRDQDGFVRIASHLHFAPRGLVWGWEGKNFLALGGAVSVDRDSRVVGQDYWYEEEILDAEVDRTIANAEGLDIDYFITHDCSNRTPFGFQIIPDFKSQLNREKIDRVLDAVRPKFQFHGHMHRWYDWPLYYGDGQGTHTHVYGLSFEFEHNALGVLDTEDDSFTPFLKKIDRKAPR